MQKHQHTSTETKTPVFRGGTENRCFFSFYGSLLLLVVCRRTVLLILALLILLLVLRIFTFTRHGTHLPFSKVTGFSMSMPFAVIHKISKEILCNQPLNQTSLPVRHRSV